MAALGLFAIASVVGGVTMFLVILSERLHRDELVAAEVQSKTATMESELQSARLSLTAVEQMATLQAKELLARNAENVRLNDIIVKLKQKLGGMDSIQ